MNWEHAGYIGVDAGLCWIGDPCYIIHSDKPPKAIGKNWHDFCDKLEVEDGLNEKGSQQFNYDLGHEGLGVVVSTGWGDGTYPVEVKKTPDGRIAEARVVFIDVDEDLYEDEDDDLYCENLDDGVYDDNDDDD